MAMQRLAEYTIRTAMPRPEHLAKWINWMKTGNVFQFMAGTNGEMSSPALSRGLGTCRRLHSGTGQPAANLVAHTIVNTVRYGYPGFTADALTWYAAATAQFWHIDTATRDLCQSVLDDHGTITDIGSVVALSTR